MRQETHWPPELNAVAEMLLRAMILAESAGRPVWDFAVEIGELQTLGVSRAELRWLVSQGLLEHAEELSAGLSDSRHYRATGKLEFSRRTCFVLTPEGRAAALRWTQRSPVHNPDSGTQHQAVVDRCGPIAAGNGKPPPEAARPGEGAGVGVAGNQQEQEAKPYWNGEARRLSLGELIVKEYRTPAPNQQLILAAFQEEGWPLRIDDPLPPEPELVSKRRLHETIAALNRKQRNQLLRFSGDGCGLGVRWSIITGVAIHTAKASEYV